PNADRPGDGMTAASEQSIGAVLLLVACQASAQPSRSPARTPLKSPVPFSGPITFDCAGAERTNDTVAATSYETRPAMVLLERAGQIRPAFRVPAASGAKYEGENLSFWEARGTAVVMWSDVEVKCRRRLGSPGKAGNEFVLRHLSRPWR